MSSSQDDLTIWEIVEQHLDEAGYLFWMRQARLSAPHYNLDDLRTGPEARLFAHIDGLLVAGTAARDHLLLPALRDEDAEPERVAAAALALLSSEHPQLGLEMLFAALPRMEGERLAALATALALADLREVPGLVARQLRHDRGPAIAAAMLQILAAYRADPGPVLDGFLESDDAAVVEAALAVAAAVPRADCLWHCERLIDSDFVQVRNRAMDAALVLGSHTAWSVCVQRAARPTAQDAHCLLLTGLLGGPREHERLRALLDAGTQVPEAVWALGFAGRGEALPALLALVDHPDERLAKLAGEAFVAVTGYTPSKSPSPAPKPASDDGDEPEEETIPFDEDDLDADLAPNAVDQLPLVAAAPAQAWWQKHAGRFAVAGGRYLAGEPLALPSLHGALRQGPCRRRPPWALALAVASGGQYHISTEAFSEQQLLQLSALASADPAPFRRLAR